MTVDVTFRGWGGHFICSSRCAFRLNTLLEKDDKKIVVSTVGDMRGPDDRKPGVIGYRRYYETMVFRAHLDGKYWDADVSEDLTGHLDDWGIFGDSVDDLPDDVDNVATTMHYNAITRIAQLMEDGTL